MEKIKNIFSPAQAKDDDVLYGQGESGKIAGEGSHFNGNSTSSTTGTNERAHGIAHTGNDTTSSNRDNLDRSLDNSATSRDPTTATSGRFDPAGDTASASSVKSGIAGHRPAHDTSAANTTAGTAAGVAGTSALHNDRTNPSGDVSSSAGVNNPIGTRSQPRSNLDSQYNTPPVASGVAPGTATTTNTPSTPYTQHSSSNPSTHESHAGRDATLGGLAGTGSAGLAAHELGKDRQTAQTGAGSAHTGAGSSNVPGVPDLTHQHKGHGHVYEGDPCPPGDEPRLTGYVPTTEGPHALDTANRLDPHVPGEFPAEDGLDKHSRTSRNAGSAGGAGLSGIAATGAKHHHDHQSTTQSTLPTRGVNDAGSTSGLSGTSSSDHHGRNAALAGGAGAAGLGAYEHSRHQEQPSTLAQAGTTAQPTAAGQSAGTFFSGPQGSAVTSHARNTTLVDQHADSPGQHQHNYGRDAAAVGGVGALGAGAYEAEKHHNTRETTGSTSETVGPHSSNLANKADPRVESDPRAQSSRLQYSDDRGRTLPTDSRASTESQQHHSGRNAAGLAGAGAIGAGAYETVKHSGSEQAPHHPRTIPLEEQRAEPPKLHQGSGPSGLAGTTASTGATSGAYNQVHPGHHDQHSHPGHIGHLGHDGQGLGAQSGGLTSGQPSQAEGVHSHSARDGAVAGGVGAAGVGAYEAGKHRNEGDITGPHPSSAANAADPRVQSSGQAQTLGSEKQHHYGRDAALGAGGVGAAGAGVHETRQQHDLDNNSPASKTLGPHQSNMANIVDPRVKPDPAVQQNQTTTGPHKSNLLNKLDPRVKNQETSPEADHHYARDGAAVGAVGAAGYGAHELGQHQEQSATRSTGGYTDTNYQSTGATGATSVPRDSSTANQPIAQQQDHHYGRDAAVVGGVGAAGAAGYGAYEHGKTPSDPARHAGTQLQPTRNEISSGAGPSASQAHQVSSGTQDRHVPSQAAQSQDQSHHGRDAAVAGGAVAAGGAGAYELSKHEQEQQAKDIAKQQKEHEKAMQHEQKEQQKAAEKQHKHDQKEAEKANKQHQKEVQKEEAKHAEEAEKAERKAEHKHEKEVAAMEKKHEKQEEVAEKKHEKDVAAAEKQRQHELEKRQAEEEKEEKKEDKKHHGLLGFLHRDKKETSPSQDEAVDSTRRESSDIAPGRTSTSSTGTGGHTHNKLHKDPPPKVQRELEEKAAERRSADLGGDAYGRSDVGSSGATDTHATGLDNTRTY